MNRESIVLGNRVRDEITGFSGIAVNLCAHCRDEPGSLDFCTCSLGGDPARSAPPPPPPPPRPEMRLSCSGCGYTAPLSEFRRNHPRCPTAWLAYVLWLIPPILLTWAFLSGR